MSTLFDAAGNVTYVKDAQNNVTTFAYDELNGKTRETDPLGKAATFAYNAVGAVASTTDRLGRRQDFAYDAANRLTTATWVQGGSTVQTLTYTYDGVGNLYVCEHATSAHIRRQRGRGHPLVFALETSISD